MRKDSKWPKGSNQGYLLEPWPRLFSVPNAYSRGRSGEGRSHITRSVQRCEAFDLPMTDAKILM